ncbi:MAG: MFS transporter [Pedobacter sp.]|nr:MAG: MFS transporter [Pedobacter sp.]
MFPQPVRPQPKTAFLIRSCCNATCLNMNTIRNVCVYCGSGPGANPAFMKAATDIGHILADNNIGLVYGGGSIGLMGAVAAYIVGDLFQWRTAFFVGGGLGFLLLALRLGVFESGMFQKMAKTHVQKGNFLMLFSNRKRFFKYLNCILIAVPLWFVVGILVGIAPDFGKALHAKEVLDNGKGVMFTYIGISLGDFLSGALSQIFKNRKKIVYIFISLTFLTMMVYLHRTGWTAFEFYILCLFFGLFTGYWVVFVTMSAEQFGTNLRATVTTSVPNMVRGSLILVSILFQWLRSEMGIINAAVAVAVLLVGLAFIALYNLEETYGRDLNFVEE